MLSQVSRSSQEGKRTYVFYADRVHRPTFLSKLRLRGFNDWINSCLKSYLKNRTQQVLLKDLKSTQISGTCGVP